MSKEATQWHQLVGKLYELLLAEFEVEVLTDFKLMSEPPRADIIIIRRQTGAWTTRELARLPDGVRHSQASHLIIEFKYSESLRAEVVEKAFGYDIFYRETQKLSTEQVSTFVLSAKTPRTEVLTMYGYEASEWPGVYFSKLPLVKRVGMLLLNELRDAPHNAFTQCFASRQQVKQDAFTTLGHEADEAITGELLSFLAGLQKHWLKKGDEIMSEGLTPEKVLELGQEVLKEALLKQLTLEERLMGLKPEERLMGLKPEERLVGLESYLAERDKKVLLQGLKRSLQIRFGVDETGWTGYEQRLQQLDFAILEQLSETALLVAEEAEFEQALSQIEAQN